MSITVQYAAILRTRTEERANKMSPLDIYRRRRALLPRRPKLKASPTDRRHLQKIGNYVFYVAIDVAISACRIKPKGKIRSPYSYKFSPM